MIDKTNIRNWTGKSVRVVAREAGGSLRTVALFKPEEQRIEEVEKTPVVSISDGDDILAVLSPKAWDAVYPEGFPKESCVQGHLVSESVARTRQDRRDMMFVHAADILEETPEEVVAIRLRFP